MIPPETIWNKVPRFIRHDFSRKMLALLFTGAIYYAVSVRTQSNQILNNIPVPLQAPEGFILQNKNSEISIQFKGSDSSMKTFSRAKIRFRDIKVDTALFEQQGIGVVNVLPENISVPMGISIISVSPQRFEVKLDKRIQRQVKVTPVFDYKDFRRNGFRIDHAEVSPKNILLSGPQTILNSMDQIRTIPISLEGVTQSFDCIAKIKLPPTNIQADVKQVNVQVIVSRNFVERTFKGLPVRLFGTLQNKYRIEVLDQTNADVTLAGPSDVLDNLKPYNIRIYLDTAQFNTPGIHPAILRCWLEKPDLKVKMIYPQSIKVKVIK